MIKKMIISIEIGRTLSMNMIKRKRAKREKEKEIKIGRSPRRDLLRNQIEKREREEKRKKGLEVMTKREREITIIIRDKKIIEEKQ